MIRFLRRRQINDERWNGVVASSRFETIYPYTWYLDACSDNWAGYVMNDFECVMPVAFRRKIGLKYTYQPVYCQQLGVYSEHRVDTEVSRMFLHELRRNFKMGDYALNEGNILGDEKGFEVSDNTNYILSLAAPYDEIHKNYTENCRRNVKRAHRSGIEFTDQVSIDEVIALKQMSGQSRLGDEHYAYAKSLFSRLATRDKIRIYGARYGDHLVAAAIFAFSNDRAIFLLSASSEHGKEWRAMFLVVDRFIEMHAEKLGKLDFEGSNIVSIARFFRGFGAKPEIYQRLRFQGAANVIINKIKGV
ncbi:MAG: GNAT family N-acetyltransferase [Bacteroidales bacterium]